MNTKWSSMVFLIAPFILSLAACSLVDAQTGNCQITGEAVINFLRQPGPPGEPGPPGQKGPKGDQGPPGPSSQVLVATTYTIWGKQTCPSTEGTSAVYTGIAAKNRWNKPGGGVDFQCMTSKPVFRNTVNGKQESRSYVMGTQFEDWVGAYNDNPKTSTFRGLVCTVCLTRRTTSIMIPGDCTCPAGWRLEYSGLLGSERSGHPSQSNFICIANGMDTPAGATPKNIHGSTVMIAEVGQDTSSFTPPYGLYQPGKEISCAVCTI